VSTVTNASAGAETSTPAGTVSAQAQAAYCADLNRLQADLNSFQARGPNPTLADIRAAMNQLNGDLTQAISDAKALNNTKVDTLTSSIHDLEQSVQNVSADSSTAAVIATVLPKAAAVGQAHSQARQPLCQ
jgi:hypothetical protein